MAAALLCAGVLGSAQASAGATFPTEVQPNEIVVKYRSSSDHQQRVTAQASAGVANVQQPSRGPRLVRVHNSDLATAVDKLRADSSVEYAVPNYRAHISANGYADYFPNDPGRSGKVGQWRNMQWNMLGATGINAPEAWAKLNAVGKPGGAGVIVAVVDTGVAYANSSIYRRSPDFGPGKFVRGYDFVNRDPFPYDENGHGTHVASTIAETADNSRALLGVAYGARIMPLRALDEYGGGDAYAIAQAVRYAADHGAQVVNMSLEFPGGIRAKQIPQIIDALKYAERKNVMIVGASGNEYLSRIAYPARSPSVMSVGATTLRGCIADYSNSGFGLDIVAPGGGSDADLPGDKQCKPFGRAGPEIYQLAYTANFTQQPPHSFRYRLDRKSVQRFTYVREEGTSMASPHVAGAAALVIASGVIGDKPTPDAIRKQLERTARDLGKGGSDKRYGAGLLDVGAATRPLPK